MEHAQRAIVCVLLERLCARGLIARSDCTRAVELVHSARDFPQLLRQPQVPTREEDAHGSAPGSQ